MIRFLLLLAFLTFLGLLSQLYLPALPWFPCAFVFLGAIFYFYSCLVLPFPAVLLFTFLFGLATDFQTLPNAAESGFPCGGSILAFLVPALIIHGFRPLTAKSTWLIPLALAPLVALLIPLTLVTQYGFLCLERREFFFNHVIMWRILGPGLAALVVAPGVFLVSGTLGRIVGYRPKRPRLG
jgi:hypothetical protein